MSCSVEGEATPTASEVKQDTKREVLYQTAQQHVSTQPRLTSYFEDNKGGRHRLWATIVDYYVKGGTYQMVWLKRRHPKESLPNSIVERSDFGQFTGSQRSVQVRIDCLSAFLGDAAQVIRGDRLYADEYCVTP